MGSLLCREACQCRPAAKLTGFDIEDRGAVDEVGATQHERISAHLEQTGDREPNRTRPVWRARGEQANLLAAEPGRVDLRFELRRLSTRLGELGGVGVFVEVVQQPHVRERLEPLKSGRLDHVRVDPERRAGRGRRPYS